jgi:hypothetical protein
MIFHEYFLKSSMGDTRWKAACLDAKSLSDPFTPVQGEAFAMMILKNNYFAWLWEYKLDLLKNKKRRGLVVLTDYDTESELRNKNNVGEALLKKAELNLEQEEENDHDDDDDGPADASSPSPHPVGTIQEPLLRELNYGNLLVPESTGSLYRDLRKKTEAALKKARRSARINQKYKELKKMLEEEAATMSGAVLPGGDGNPGFDYDVNPGVDDDDDGNPGVDDDEDDEALKQEQRAKKRKILKSFREYTNPQEDENRFKGWSMRASEEMQLLQAVLNDERSTTRARLFCAAYRLTFSENLRSGKKKQRVPQESAPLNYQCNIWGLRDIPQVEI